MPIDNAPAVLGDHSAEPPGHPEFIHDPARKRNILIAMCVALMAVISSVSILNVAQQQLAVDFGVSHNTVLWIINAYTLVLAALLMPVGAIGDRWGRKTVLLCGLVLMAAASVFAALAGSAALMIAARAIAGAAAAMIMPVTLSVITSSFPPHERAQAIGIWAGVAGAGAMVGMFIAAFMFDVASWRWAFLLPIALLPIALVLTLRAVPNTRELTTHRFDIGGSILSALAIGGLVLGIHEGPERGWGDPLTVAGLVVGVAAALAFVAWELRQTNPLLDVRAFADRGLAAGSLTILLLFAVMFGVMLVLFPFFQAVLGWTALRSAVAMLPMALLMMPTSALAPRLAQRIGSRVTMLIGLGIAAAGIITLALSASVEGGYLSVLPGLLMIGLGMGFTMTPSTAAITESLPIDKQGVASALNDTTREVGGALGIALLGAVVASGYKDAIAPALVGLPAEIATPASEGIGTALGIAMQGGLDPAQALGLVDAAQHAFVEGWVRSMWFGIALIAIAFVYVLVRGPRAGRVDSVLLTDDRELDAELLAFQPAAPQPSSATQADRRAVGVTPLDGAAGRQNELAHSQRNGDDR